MFTVRLTNKAKAWRNAVALSWGLADRSPKAVTLESQGDLWQFSVGGQTVKLDWRTGRALSGIQ
jgi:hypothetical protein